MVRQPTSHLGHRPSFVSVWGFWGWGFWAVQAALVANVAPAYGQTPETPRSPAAAAISPEDAVFFERKIRPVLVAECYACHATGRKEPPRGGLALDSREGTRKGGDSGVAIVPGKPDESPLLAAITHRDPEFAMPPKKKLDDPIVRDFEEWIRRGAPDTRQDTVNNTASPSGPAQGKDHWAFQLPRKAEVPKPKNASWPRTDVDRFVLTVLEAQGLTPVDDAEPHALLRRLTFDLTGIPPTSAELDLLANTSPEASYEATVDRLLASPQFGEKWARHWLDVARYAESTGKTVNFAYPHAWRYRDYVIAAFNNDKPYDQFILEQLAGDLLPSDDPRVKAERLIATGFLAIGPKTLNERSGLKFELDLVDEQIDVVSQAFLGLTAACARCHDHKFDPILQADYYALAGIFRSTETCYGTVSFINAQRVSLLMPLPADAQVTVPSHRLSESEKNRIERQISTVRESIQNSKDGQQRFFATGQLSLLQARLDGYNTDGFPKLLAMGVRDKPPGPESRRFRDRFGGFAGFTSNGSRTIGDSPVFTRGEADQPGETRVPRGTLSVLSKEPLSIPASTSGRRELAQWIASPDNPLTARVMVNRIWLQLFGRGLVPTADDFGMAGRPPSHPELLDHLALRFMDEGWSVKKLIKYIVLSHTYQLSSHSQARAREIDPDNIWLWRMSPRRLDAESLRDSILAVSGQLQLTPPQGSVVSQGGEGPVSRPRLGGDPVMAAINDPRDTRRSIYLPIIRDNLPESLALFDAADPALITSDRKQTTVPSQGLFLLNNAFVLRASEAAAEKLLIHDSDVERVQLAYRQCYGRSPTVAERSAALTFVQDYQAKAADGRSTASRRKQEAWSAFYQALLASAEFQLRP